MRPAVYRRKFFINKELQGQIIFKYFILFAMGSILFTLTFSFFSSNTLSIVYEDYHLQLGTTPGILMNKILSTQWIFIVLGGIAMVVFTTLLTHRIAGPFFRFDATMDEMLNKNLSYKIFLRKKDEGQELGEKINQFNALISFELDQILQNSEKIKQYCELTASAAAPDLESAPSISALKKIEQLNKDSLDVINGFTLLKD